MSAARRTRVALADDHPIVLDGLVRLFALEEDFEVVARCRDGEETLRAVAEDRPDLLILDLKMPGTGGMAVLSQLKRASRDVPVLLLTAAIENHEIVEALRCGVRGIVLKETAADVVVQASRRIAGGGQWLDSALIARALDEFGPRGDAAADAADMLTPREREIVGMVARGLRNRAIADRLGITEGTVKLHLHHVYEKLGLSGRFELVLFAQKRGL